jgi:DNA-binding response OmpR family regulator
MLGQFSNIPHNCLRDRCVLIVEDESLIGMLIEEEVLEAGARVLGPEMTLESAMRRIREAGPGVVDVAVLDLDLNGARSQPVATALRERGIPFVVTTGYDARRVEGIGDMPVIVKPFDGARLVRTLAGLLEAETRPGGISPSCSGDNPGSH